VVRCPPPFPGKPPPKPAPVAAAMPEAQAHPSSSSSAPAPETRCRSQSPCVRPGLGLECFDDVPGLSAPKPRSRVLATGEAPPVPQPPPRRSIVPRRRAISESPTSFLMPMMEDSDGERDFNRSGGAPAAPSCPPIIHNNVATFERPRAYAAALRSQPSLTRPLVTQATAPKPRRPKRSPIDEAVQREFLGEGMALDQAVAQRKGAGWAVQQRHVHRTDVGHCCHACRQPLRDLNEEVTVWTGAAIYRRFHPACAASFMLKCDTEDAAGGGGGPAEDIVEGYADGWRALRDTAPGNAGRGGVEAARNWLLSQDPNAWQGLRGDLFTTVTVYENGKKKAVPGLSHEQIRILEARCKWCPAAPQGAGGSEGEPVQVEEEVECAICFGGYEAGGPPCVRLPCAPQHIFHLPCVLPWLRKASLCPTCRRDLRPLLPPARGASR